MNIIKDISIGAKENFLKKEAANIKEKIKKNDEKNQILKISKNSFEIENGEKVCLNNNIHNNLEEFDDTFIPECQNFVIKFYASTAEYLKKTEQYYNIHKNCYQSNNFIPKKRVDLTRNEDEYTSIDVNDNNDNNFFNSNYENK